MLKKQMFLIMESPTVNVIGRRGVEEMTAVSSHAQSVLDLFRSTALRSPDGVSE